jgi:CspA family cold shock protein
MNDAGQEDHPMDLEIQTQHLTLDPAWRDLIEQTAANIAQRYPDTIRMHVTLKHAPHHRRGAEIVTVLANTEGRVLRTEKTGEYVHDAIRAAFDAFEMEIERAHEQHREAVKANRGRLEGSIKRIFRNAGYGFIHYQPGRDVYFHRAALHGLNFDALEPGDPVEFVIEQGERGLQAPQVHPIGSHGRT